MRIAKNPPLYNKKIVLDLLQKLIFHQVRIKINKTFVFISNKDKITILYEWDDIDYKKKYELYYSDAKDFNREIEEWLNYSWNKYKLSGK